MTSPEQHERTPQTPLPSGFDGSTTAREVLAGTDLGGRTAVVTGGASGLGVETVRALRAAGASVVVPARDPAKAAAALAGVPGVETAPMDLVDPASVDAFAAGFLASGRPLHLLVNSAGVMAAPLDRDADGHERHFATNHLGHFRLTRRLWPALLAAGSARVVAVSSWGHRRSDIVWEDIDFERRPYDPMDAYGQSKTANNLFAVELDRRGRAHGVRAFAAHPGAILTPLARHLDAEALRGMGVLDEGGAPVIDASRNMKTPEQGAATAVWCATSPRLDGLGGVYCENCDIAPLAEDDGPLGHSTAQAPAFGVRPYSVDPDAARRLWTLSEGLTGLS